jgi:hypothetical protein
MADEAEQIDDAIVSSAAEELHVRLPADRPPFRQRFTAGV